MKLYSEAPLLLYLLSGETVTWVFGRRLLVESWSLSYIPAYRFSVRDESHRLSRSFILGGIPKDTSIRFQREPSQSYLFTAFSTSLQCQTRALSLSLRQPAPLQSPASPSQVGPSKVPSCVLYRKPLKDLFDIEREGIISCPLKNRDAVI